MHILQWKCTIHNNKQFIDELTTAIDGAISKNPAVRPGWTDKCSKFIGKKHALNRLKRPSPPGNYIIYKKVRAFALRRKRGRGDRNSALILTLKLLPVMFGRNSSAFLRQNFGIPLFLDTNKQCVVTDTKKDIWLVKSFAAVSGTANYMEDFHKIKECKGSKFEIKMIIMRLPHVQITSL